MAISEDTNAHTPKTSTLKHTQREGESERKGELQKHITIGIKNVIE